MQPQLDGAKLVSILESQQLDPTDKADIEKLKSPLGRDKDSTDDLQTEVLEALERLRANDFPCDRRLVLLDLNMPRMNGIEFLRELRKDPELHATPVVVLTTSDDERDKVDAYGMNVAGYLLKPVTFASFVEIMAALNKYWTLVEMP